MASPSLSQCMCTYSCMCMYLCRCVCTYMKEPGKQCPVSSSIALHFFLKQCLSMNLKFIHQGRVAGQQAPWIFLPLPPQHWDNRHTRYHFLMWLLGTEIRSSYLRGQHLVNLANLLNPGKCSSYCFSKSKVKDRTAVTRRSHQRFFRWVKCLVTTRVESHVQPKHTHLCELHDYFMSQRRLCLREYFDEIGKPECEILIYMSYQVECVGRAALG